MSIAQQEVVETIMGHIIEWTHQHLRSCELNGTHNSDPSCLRMDSIMIMPDLPASVSLTLVLYWKLCHSSGRTSIVLGSD